MPDIANLQVRIGADTSDAESGFKRVNSSIGGFASAAGMALAGASLAIGAAGVAAVSAASGFEKTMSGVKAVSGATATELKGLSSLALQLGKDTVFSASDAAAGIEELVKGGLSVADIMGGAAKATLDLATAGGVSLPDAAIIAANALAQFNLKGGDMAHVADLIAGAANASALDVGQFKLSLQMAGAVASTVGFSFDDLAVAIAEMGKAGITGSDAGTSLKTMFLNLTPSTKQATEEMQALGIITKDGANQFFDATGKVKSMAEVAQVLSTATAGLTQQQKLQALQTLFGTDAIRAAAVFAKAGAAGFDEMAASMGKVTAASVGAERLNNLAGDIEQLKGSVETAAITFGTVFLPVLRDGAQLVTGFVNSLIPWIERVGPGIVEWATKAGTSLSTFATDVSTAFGTGGVMGVIDLVGPKLLGKLGEWGTALVSWVEPMISPLLVALGKLATRVWAWIGEQYQPILTKLGDWGHAFLNWVGPAIAPMVSEAGKLLSALGTWITDTAAPAILGKLGEWGKQFTAWIGPATTAFLAAWPANLTRFLDWIEFTAAPAIKTALTSWATAFVAWIGVDSKTGAAGGVGTALLNIASAIWTFIDSTLSILQPRLGKWALAFLGWIVTDVVPFIAIELGKIQLAIGKWILFDAIPWAATAFFDLGKAIVLGIVRGILSLPNAIGDAVKSLVVPTTLPAAPAPQPGGITTVRPASPRPGETVTAGPNFTGQYLYSSDGGRHMEWRDRGGRGVAGTPYAIGLPEVFIPDRPGNFVPLGGAGAGGDTHITVPVSIGGERIMTVVAKANRNYANRGGR